MIYQKYIFVNIFLLLGNIDIFIRKKFIYNPSPVWYHQESSGDMPAHDKE